MVYRLFLQEISTHALEHSTFAGAPDPIIWFIKYNILQYHYNDSFQIFSLCKIFSVIKYFQPWNKWKGQCKIQSSQPPLLCIQLIGNFPTPVLDKYIVLCCIISLLSSWNITLRDSISDQPDFPADQIWRHCFSIYHLFPPVIERMKPSFGHFPSPQIKLPMGIVTVFERIFCFWFHLYFCFMSSKIFQSSKWDHSAEVHGKFFWEYSSSPSSLQRLHTFYEGFHSPAI